MAGTPTTTVQTDAERFYSDLQALEQGSREDAERLLPIAEQQVENHRAIVTRLTSLLDRAQAELDRWAITAGELRATIDPGLEPTGAALRGKQIGEVAVKVLEESGKAQPIHYRDWLDLVRLAGYRVGGAEPTNSFLTALHRHPRIESIGARTGLWKLRDQDAA
jgi:hypothetical protein